MFGYIIKYCSKAEKKIDLYEALICNLLFRISYCTPFVSFVSRFINKLVSERDWIAQKVCYHLLNFFLMEGSRVILDIDCRPPGNRSRSIIINEEGIYETTNAYEKYTACDAS